MIQYAFVDGLEDNESVRIVAENQEWDEATLKQLRDEYNVFFMTSGDAVMPVMLTTADGGLHGRKLVVLGSEDDGTICFDREYGHFKYRFDPFWIDSLIADLRAVKKFMQDGLNMKDENKQLKPCPFCGGDGVMQVIHGSQDMYFVSCVNLQCAVRPSTCFWFSEDDAVDSWNNRESSSKQP